MGGHIKSGCPKMRACGIEIKKEGWADHCSQQPRVQYAVLGDTLPGSGTHVIPLWHRATGGDTWHVIVYEYV